MERLLDELDTSQKQAELSDLYNVDVNINKMMLTNLLRHSVVVGRCVLRLERFSSGTLSSWCTMPALIDVFGRDVEQICL